MKVETLKNSSFLVNIHERKLEVKSDWKLGEAVMQLQIDDEEETVHVSSDNYEIEVCFFLQFEYRNGQHVDLRLHGDKVIGKSFCY